MNETKKCLFCEKPIKNTPGRRPKKYCDDNCRQKHFQAQRRDNAAANHSPSQPKKKTPAPSKKKVTKTNPGLPQKDELILPGPIGQMEFMDGTSAEILQTKSDFQKGTLTITTGPRYPNEYKPLLDLAKSGEVNDLTAFREHVRKAKLTGPQRDMIYSKLSK